MPTVKQENLAHKQLYLSAFGKSDLAAGVNHCVDSFIDVTLTSAQVDALNATPVELVPAPGSGKALIFKGAFCFLDYNTTAWEGSSETIPIKYENASGATVGTLTEAFIESSADAYQWVEPVTAIALANKALVATANADITTGNSPIYLRVYYRVITVDMSAV